MCFYWNNQTVTNSLSFSVYLTFGIWSPCIYTYSYTTWSHSDQSQNTIRIVIINNKILLSHSVCWMRFFLLFLWFLTLTNKIWFFFLWNAIISCTASYFGMERAFLEWEIFIWWSEEVRETSQTRESNVVRLYISYFQSSPAIRRMLKSKK